MCVCDRDSVCVRERVREKLAHTACEKVLCEKVSNRCSNGLRGLMGWGLEWCWGLGISFASKSAAHRDKSREWYISKQTWNRW